MLADLMIAIKEWHRILPDELDSTDRKFNSKRFFVNLFEKSWSERAMHTNRSRNYLLCYFGVSENPSCFPAFLIHNLDRSFRAGFFPARVVGHGDGGNRFFFD